MQVFLNLLSKVVPGLFESVAVDYRDISRPQITICVFNQKNLLLLLFFIKAHSRLLLNCLVDLTAADWLGAELTGVFSLLNLNSNRFQVVYNLLSFYFNFRVRLAFFIDEWVAVLSISFLFKVANWLEREIWDMFGIFFNKHADLRRILTDYGFSGFPLRKDFPLSGYEEVCYSETLKGVTYDYVELSQEMRSVELVNPWVARLSFIRF